MNPRPLGYEASLYRRVLCHNTGFIKRSLESHPLSLVSTYLFLLLSDDQWRHAFLIERGKMTTSRYQKIQQRDEPNSLLASMPPLTNVTVFFDDRGKTHSDWLT